jgi:predicted MFS family arabinose efflux permease
MSTILSLTLGIYGFMLCALIAIITLTSTATAVRDVSVDGIMCIEGKKYNLCGNIQAVQWISVTIASIFVGLIGGWLATTANYKLGFLFLIPVYIIAGIIVFKYQENTIKREKESCTTILKKYKVLWQNKSFLIACVFMFLYCFAPSFGTPLSFLQRDKFLWSERFIGILSAVISVCEIIGAVLYYKFNKRINVRKWLIFSVFFGALTTMCYLYYTNVSAIVYGVLFAIIGMIIHLILMDFTARTSLPGLEASSFAVLCGIHNLAGTASALTGAYLFPKIGLQPLIIIASLTSFACLPLISHLKLEGKNEKTISQ